METYDQIKKFLDEGGRCLLIENGEPIGVVLTVEEYELLRSKSSSFAKASEEKQVNPEIIPPQTPPYQGGERGEVATHPIGEVIANEIEFPGVSANLDEINLADAESVTLEDLGLDPDIQLPADF